MMIIWRSWSSASEISFAWGICASTVFTPYFLRIFYIRSSWCLRAKLKCKEENLSFKPFWSFAFLFFPSVTVLPNFKDSANGTVTIYTLSCSFLTVFSAVGDLGLSGVFKDRQEWQAVCAEGRSQGWLIQQDQVSLLWHPFTASHNLSVCNIYPQADSDESEMVHSQHVLPTWGCDMLLLL